MNYRHAFHAGNFADLLKHASVLSMLRALQEAHEALLIVDTHAGAGLYDLSDPHQPRSKEARLGAEAIFGNPPEALQALAEIVRSKNPDGVLRTYPGSPALILSRLRGADAYVGCELRPDDFYQLKHVMPRSRRAEARLCDGYEEGVARVAEARASEGIFVLIDPPFERGDDYARIVEATLNVLALRPDAAVLIWTPLKDLETFDALIRDFEAAGAPAADVLELRLRPLNQPLKMNGCALVFFGAPAPVIAEAQAAAAAVFAPLSEPGGQVKLWRSATPVAAATN